jgi:hypothetical protein
MEHPSVKVRPHPRSTKPANRDCIALHGKTMLMTHAGCTAHAATASRAWLASRLAPGALAAAVRLASCPRALAPRPYVCACGCAPCRAPRGSSPSWRTSGAASHRCLEEHSGALEGGQRAGRAVARSRDGCSSPQVCRRKEGSFRRARGRRVGSRAAAAVPGCACCAVMHDQPASAAPEQLRGQAAPRSATALPCPGRHQHP